MDELLAQWRWQPNANVGICLGAVSQLVDLRGHFRVRQLAEQRQLLLLPARPVIARRQVLREVILQGVLAAYLTFFLREFPGLDGIRPCRLAV
jgi:hypothetical protein